MPQPGSSTCNTISALGSITPGIFTWCSRDKIISGRVSRTLSIAAAVSRNCLTPYNSLCRVGSHSHCIGNHGLCFRSEVIGICSSYNHVTVQFFHGVCLGNFFITLRRGSGNNSNLKIFRCRLIFAAFLSFSPGCRLPQPQSTPRWPPP